jgi:hypothetical protein
LNDQFKRRADPRFSNIESCVIGDLPAIDDRRCLIGRARLTPNPEFPITTCGNRRFIQVDYEDLLERALNKATGGRYIDAIPGDGEIDFLARLPAHFKHHFSRAGFDGEDFPAPVGADGAMAVSDELRT